MLERAVAPDSPMVVVFALLHGLDPLLLETADGPVTSYPSGADAALQPRVRPMDPWLTSPLPSRVSADIPDLQWVDRALPASRARLAAMAGVALDSHAQGRQDACAGGCLRFREETILEAAAPGGLDWPSVDRVQRGESMSLVLLAHPCAILWAWAPMACRDRLDAFFAAADGRPRH